MLLSIWIDIFCIFFIFHICLYLPTIIVNNIQINDMTLIYKSPIDRIEELFLFNTQLERLKCTQCTWPVKVDLKVSFEIYFNPVKRITFPENPKQNQLFLYLFRLLDN